jgi:5-amino-6-(5-phosphoribosylamino)uracil reductase/diaminohydroxyphosphoribosylaminopyrimidine deaminase/5-amino-6-(5-phosphoribosylamino)uracil reductase
MSYRFVEIMRRIHRTAGILPALEAYGIPDVFTAQPSQRTARSLVTVAYAQTLDGRLATRTGSSQWISSPESLRLAHELRAGHDAILVGVGTILRDNPRLTVRLANGRDPLRIVVDSALRTPLDGAVLADGAAPGTLLAATPSAAAERVAALEALGATVLRVPPDASGRVELAALMAALADRGVRSVLVEGGARIITSVLRARLVDRLVVTVAPLVLGAGIAAVGDLGIADLARALRLQDVQVRAYGPDMVFDGRVMYPEEADGGGTDDTTIPG